MSPHLGRPVVGVGRGQAAQVGARALRVHARAQEARVAVELHHVEDLLLGLHVGKNIALKPIASSSLVYTYQYILISINL